MSIFGVITIMLAIAAWVYAPIAYTKASWYANNDLMGASFVFEGAWFVGAFALSLGLVFTSILKPPTAFFLFLGLVILGKLIEWFVMPALLYRLFPDYQKKVWTLDGEKKLP